MSQFHTTRGKVWVLECCGDIFGVDIQTRAVSLNLECHDQLFYSSFVCLETSFLVVGSKVKINTAGETQSETIQFKLIHKRGRRRVIKMLEFESPVYSLYSSHQCIKYSSTSNPVMCMKRCEQHLVVASCQFDSIFLLEVKDNHSYNKPHCLRLVYKIDVSQFCSNSPRSQLCSHIARSAFVNQGMRKSWGACQICWLEMDHLQTGIFLALSESGVNNMKHLHFKEL